jgi:hypothetical protein
MPTNMAGTTSCKGKIMASFHCSIKNGKKGTAAIHAAYIAREGKHSKSKDIVAMEYGNMPEWALGNPSQFWRMADKFERVNGAAYREFELALPQELTDEQQRELLDEFISHVIGNKPYQVAIHSPKAALGDVNQTHGHIMVSDRIPDGISRPPELHFKRFNSNHPELGGCKKSSGGKAKWLLKEDLKAIRATFADLQNKKLEKYGHEARVDHRSYRDRGIEKDAEKHLGAAAIKKMSEEEKAQIKDKRQSNKMGK